MRIIGGIARNLATDAELLEAHVSGDRTAFPELMRRHYQRLWQVARRTSYCAEDAADALQEAMLSAHRTAATFREDAAVASWLHTIVVNACLDRIRRNKARPTVPLHERHQDSIHDNRDRIIEVEASMVIDAALAALPPEQRAAIVAVDVEGYSVNDAAARLGVPVGTVKSRCARARAKLAVTLGYMRTDDDRPSGRI